MGYEGRGKVGVICLFILLFFFVQSLVLGVFSFSVLAGVRDGMYEAVCYFLVMKLERVDSLV